MGKGDFRETARAASDIEHPFSLEVFFGPPRDGEEPFAREVRAVAGVELQAGEFVPLVAEGCGVVFRRHESGNVVDNRVAELPIGR